MSAPRRRPAGEPRRARPAAAWSALAALALAPSCGGEAGGANAAHLERGRGLYEVSCGGCHLPDGAGKESVGPPLAGSPWVAGPPERLIRIALHGVRGPLVVGGKAYNSEMPAFKNVFNDDEMAALLTYVRHAWGSGAAPVAAPAVAASRSATAARGDSWTVEELRDVR